MGSSTLFAGRCCHLCRRTAAGQCGDPAFSQHGRFPAVHDPAEALYRTGRPAAGNHRHGKCVPDSAGLRQYLGLFEKGNSLLTETLHKATHDAPPFPQLSYLPKSKKRQTTVCLFFFLQSMDIPLRAIFSACFFRRSSRKKSRRIWAHSACNKPAYTSGVQL